MKKTAALLLVILLAVSLCAPALAAQYQDANWLYADWELNGYPDDVGGVYSYDGDATHLCVLLVGRTPEREAEIRASLEDSETLRFGDATRPYSEVLAARGEIESAYMNDEQYGIASMGVTVNGAKTDFVVSVDVTADRYDETARILKEKYGDTVEVICSEAPTADNAADGTADGETAEKPARTPRETITYMVLYIGLVLVSILLYARRKKRAKERK